MHLLQEEQQNINQIYWQYKEVIGVKVGTEPAGSYTFPMQTGITIMI
jgi:D-alanyl-D-alanine carboxypeptidase